MSKVCDTLLNVGISSVKMRERRATVGINKADINGVHSIYSIIFTMQHYRLNMIMICSFSLMYTKLLVNCYIHF